MATDDLNQINNLFDGLIERLSKQERKQLARNISRKLRASQAKRIKENKAPDGSDYTARKPQPSWRTKKGSIKKKLMFQKLIRTKYLKAKYTGEQASVGFIGLLAYIARQHQYGLRAKVNNDVQVQYPERQLLGFTAEEQLNIEDLLIKHLS
ncbi:phage virion morphogenesis protein [Pseudoalteromonas sp. MMG013]|uniref:phage virion morphogenesis protein n=1 Tax=Pseudoalteromonas sp. MMG013 TaxID=2822687 RepID=UPI001B382A02|nr:phage virion morphogenesis protein [Pseudoalteromonas sp. MMG013]MBQ4864607.1 phage virion morphogenesis protein [Pseudoalteromonas sp. MMG013]